jgi:hypothetical protein
MVDIKPSQKRPEDLEDILGYDKGDMPPVECELLADLEPQPDVVSFSPYIRDDLAELDRLLVAAFFEGYCL